jgi:hypothetical protein
MFAAYEILMGPATLAEFFRRRLEAFLFVSFGTYCSWLFWRLYFVVIGYGTSGAKDNNKISRHSPQPEVP